MAHDVVLVEVGPPEESRRPDVRISTPDGRAVVLTWGAAQRVALALDRLVLREPETPARPN